VRVVDTLTGLESGYFVAMAVPTEATMPGVVANVSPCWKMET